MANPDERRRHARFECKGRAEAYFTPSAPPCPAAILELSLGGGLIALKQPREAEVGESIEVAFTVNRLPFRVRAQIRSVRSDRVLGLLFVLSERVEGQLEDLIEELAQDKTKRGTNPPQGQVQKDGSISKG